MKVKVEIEATPEEVRELFDPSQNLDVWSKITQEYTKAWVKLWEPNHDNQK
jgi:hypothetical protein